MAIKIKTETYPACHGIACHLHARCARYQAVEGSAADPNTMGTCLDGEGFPEFVDTLEASAPSHKAALVELAAQAGHA